MQVTPRRPEPRLPDPSRAAAAPADQTLPPARGPDGPAAHLLPYGTSPAPHRRRWFRRVTGLLIVSAVAAGAWRFHAPVSARAELLYRQRQCLTYALPADAQPGKLAVPQCWQRFSQMTGTWYTPRGPLDCSIRFDELDGVFAGIAFLHERTSPSGKRRLVAVQAYGEAGKRPDRSDPRHDLEATTPQQRLSLTFNCSVRSPGTPFRPPTRDKRAGYELDAGLGADVRIYCGRPDPADASRFSFRYEIDGRFGTIDARLRDDDTVGFEVRDGPAKQIDAAFRHERTSPSGNRRLVTVQARAFVSDFDESNPRYDPYEPRWPFELSIEWSVRTLGSVLADGATDRSNRVIFDGGLGSAARVFRGRPHPHDPSRFSLPYEVGGKPGTIDARLRDDNTITFEVRDGPAAAQAGGAT